MTLKDERRPSPLLRAQYTKKAPVGLLLWGHFAGAVVAAVERSAPSVGVTAVRLSARTGRGSCGLL